ncbi:MAG: NPCBM/NEW2 domain-containing protein [Treponema sp.]|jgi:hypothetical protein|nr:NPCBM/NEW2 domain-containing protein [Treponema sp.]
MKCLKSVLMFLLVFGFVVPVFGQETDFAYLDHLLVYRTGRYFFVNRWHDDTPTTPFSDKNDRVFNYGIGMWSDNGGRSGVGYAEYQMDGTYSLFETTLALDRRWLGDRGTTRFIIYADENEIYNVRFNSSSEPVDISVAIPGNTNLLRLEVEQISNGGTHGAIWGHAILRK